MTSLPPKKNPGYGSTPIITVKLRKENAKVVPNNYMKVVYIK